MLRYYQRLHEKNHVPPPTEIIAYDVTEQSTYVYVPTDDSEGSSDWGLYIHIHAGDRGYLPEGWADVLRRHRLIYASPHGVGNNQAPVLRVAVSLDTLATLKHDFRIEGGRVYVGGFSGGAAIAAVVALNYPEYFRGVILHARNFMWQRTQDPKDRRYAWPREVEYLSDKDIKPLADAALKWAFITGENDFNHYPVLRSARGWKERRLPMRIFDTPGMDHRPAPPESLDLALRWLEGEEVSGLEPRYEMYGLKPPKEN